MEIRNRSRKNRAISVHSDLEQNSRLRKQRGKGQARPQRKSPSREIEPVAFSRKLTDLGGKEKDDDHDQELRIHDPTTEQKTSQIPK